MLQVGAFGTKSILSFYTLVIMNAIDNKKIIIFIVKIINLNIIKKLIIRVSE